MRKSIQIGLSIFFPVYLAVVLFTDVSLAGFWTDVIFSVLLAVFLVWFNFKNITDRAWLNFSLKSASLICAFVVTAVFMDNLLNPFSWDKLKLRSFYFQKVEGRLFNAYFKPVGSYAGGQGNFWISETPLFFPVIEWRVYWNRTVHHDFNDDTFDGSPVDNYEVVRIYIQEEVIDKDK